MKRYGNLYPLIYDLDNISLAHKNARKGKTHYREVRKVDEDPERYFWRIHYMLKNKTFHNSRYKVYEKFDGNKNRTIYRLPYFPDRIIHHCIMQVVESIWHKSLISDTYACIKGRGIHKGAKRIQKALKSNIIGTKYCLKCDISKFYPSVNHEVLKKLIRKRLKDNDMLWLLDTIIDSAPGIPIGNYLSQHFGNLYLSDLDHNMKEREGCKYYYRYCDDIVILHEKKSFLHSRLQNLQDYLQYLKLYLKSNFRIFPVSEGIDFLGYKFFHYFTLVRKSIKMKFRRKVGHIKKNWSNMLPISVLSCVMSYLGWLKYSDSFNLTKKYIDMYIKTIIKKVASMDNIRNPLLNIKGGLLR